MSYVIQFYTPGESRYYPASGQIYASLEAAQTECDWLTKTRDLGFHYRVTTLT